MCGFSLIVFSDIWLPFSLTCKTIQCLCISTQYHASANPSLPSLASAYHCLSLRCNAIANVSLLRLCESVPCLAICETYLCHALAVTSLQCLCLTCQNYAPAPPLYAMPFLCFSINPVPLPFRLCCAIPLPNHLHSAMPLRFPTLLCNAIANQNLTFPSHSIYAPYATAHRCPSLLCRRHPESCPCYDLPRHCTTVHSCASAILCLAPIRCAFAFNPVSCIAPAILYFVPPSQCKLFGTKPLHYCTSLRRTKPSLRHVTPLRI